MRTHAVKWGLLVTVAALCFVGYAGVQGALGVMEGWTKNLPSIEDTDFTNTSRESVMYGKARSGNVRGDQPIRAGRHRRHRGRAFLRARRRGHPRYRARLRQQPARRRPGRRFHHHPTARAQHRVVRRGDRHLLRAQDPRGRAGHRFGETLQQRRHPGQVLEHHQLRGRLLRHRSGRAELLPGVGARPDARAGRHARRHPAVAHLS